MKRPCASGLQLPDMHSVVARLSGRHRPLHPEEVASGEQGSGAPRLPVAGISFSKCLFSKTVFADDC